jgi:RNA polymerase sigma-B factor
MHDRLARSLAGRFKRRSVDIEDLTQVALMGLLKAIDRFDPERGVQFSTYAAATILGELKRHLRDSSWDIRPPRRVHDIYLAVERTIDDLAQQLGRAPRIDEVAGELGISTEEVLEAIDAASGRWLPSLDSPVSDGATVADAVGREDHGLLDVEGSMTVTSLLSRLQEHDERVLRMRFVDGMTMREIASELGRSQMHVSRRVARGLERLRALTQNDSCAYESR